MEGTIVGAGGDELPLPKFFFFIFNVPHFVVVLLFFVFKQNSPKVKKYNSLSACLFNSKGSRIRTNVARVAVLYVLVSSGHQAIGMSGSA